MQFTATQSTFVMTAGPVDLTVNFLSPVEVGDVRSGYGGRLLTSIYQPNEMVKQSLPFSYFTLSAAPNDGKSHTVQVYSDISAEWVTGDNSLLANWSTTTGSIVTHQVQLQKQQAFTEVSDHIQRELCCSRKDDATLELTIYYTEGSAFYATQSVRQPQPTVYRS